MRGSEMCPHPLPLCTYTRLECGVVHEEWATTLGVRAPRPAQLPQPRLGGEPQLRHTWRAWMGTTCGPQPPRPWCGNDKAIHAARTRAELLLQVGTPCSRKGTTFP